MRVLLVTPAAKSAWTGNRVTAERWARILAGLGHSVRVEEAYRGEPCDLLVALPMRGRVQSLNASASLAAALFAYVLPTRLPALRPLRAHEDDDKGRAADPEAPPR